LKARKTAFDIPSEWLVPPINEGNIKRILDTITAKEKSVFFLLKGVNVRKRASKVS
jgi:hypothetical protein